MNCLDTGILGIKFQKHTPNSKKKKNTIQKSENKPLDHKVSVSNKHSKKGCQWKHPFLFA